MKWVVSIGVICSFLVNCSVKPSANRKRLPLRVGVQTQLLSVDHLSVNSLGESRVINLINPKIFYVDDKKKIKSDYSKVFFNGESLRFFDEESNKELEDSFKAVKKSILWGSYFNGFVFKTDLGITCTLEESCVAKFITLISVLRSKKYALYNLMDFVKGKKIVLQIKKAKDDLPDSIVFRRIKNADDGLSYLKKEKIDLFYPHEKVSGVDKNLKYLEKKGRSLRLSLYYKFNEKPSHAFVKAFCSSIGPIKSSFKDWVISYNVCENERNITFENSNNVSVVGDTKLTTKFFDIIYQNKSNELLLNYNILEPYNLTKVLKDGNFDLYMTEEIYDESYPVLYEAFHSNGEFNTLKYKSPSLDKLLEKSLKVKTVYHFYEIQDQVKKALLGKEPLLIRFTKKKYNCIYRIEDALDEEINKVIQYLE